MTGTETSHQPILQMVGIEKEFPGVKVLSEVNFSVKRGEIHAICGENGAGKSTLMNILSGTYPQGSFGGEIIFNGERMGFKSIRDSEAKGIVIIHQELALSPYLSVAENVFIGNEQARIGIIDWHKTNAEAAKLLARVGLDINPATKVVDLGVGRQQLVEIAKALSKQVRLLILDEPTAALNDADSAHLLDLMRHLKDQGVTMIMISHKLAEIAEIADTTTVIRDGKTVGTLDMRGPETVSEDDIIRLMVGRQLSDRYPNRESRITTELLRIEDWTVHHPLDTERKVVDKANLTVRAGEVVGIAGLMGAGRTELAMSIFGHSYGTKISGTVYRRGKPVDVSSVSKAIKSGIAYATEDRKVYGLNLLQTIRENITAAAALNVSRHGVYNREKEAVVADRYRDALRIKSPSAESYVGNLSGGNQQKVVLAKWIFTDPEVLILDEPTRGIDVGAKYEIYQIINDLVGAGKGVLMISSELPELLGVCDRIYTMSQGVVTAEVPGVEATQETLMHYMTRDKAKASA